MGTWTKGVWFTNINIWHANVKQKIVWITPFGFFIRISFLYSWTSTCGQIMMLKEWWSLKKRIWFSITWEEFAISIWLVIRGSVFHDEQRFCCNSCNSKNLVKVGKTGTMQWCIYCRTINPLINGTGIHLKDWL